MVHFSIGKISIQPHKFITHAAISFCPPKFCITFVIENNAVAIFFFGGGGGGQIRCIMGDVQVAYRVET